MLDGFVGAAVRFGGGGEGSPSEDNPLAEPLDDDVDVEDLDMEGGKTPEESDDEDSSAEDDEGDEED